MARTMPTEIVKAFCKACNDGEYSKAERLVTKDSLDRMANMGLAGSLSAYCSDLTEKGTFKKVEILSEKVRGKGRSSSSSSCSKMAARMTAGRR